MPPPPPVHVTWKSAERSMVMLPDVGNVGWVKSGCAGAVNVVVSAGTTSPAADTVNVVAPVHSVVICENDVYMLLVSGVSMTVGVLPEIVIWPADENVAVPVMTVPA